MSCRTRLSARPTGPENLRIRSQAAALAKPVENDPIHGRATVAIRIGEPDELGNFRAGAQLARVGGLVTRHPDGHSVRQAMRLRLEGAQAREGSRPDLDGKLLADLAPQALLVGLPCLALASG